MQNNFKQEKSGSNIDKNVGKMTYRNGTSTTVDFQLNGTFMVDVMSVCFSFAAISLGFNNNY